MPATPRRLPAAGGPSIAEEAKRVSAEGEALARLAKMLEELRGIFATHPRLVELFEADVVQLKTELSAPTDEGEEGGDEPEGDDEADETALSNPDRLAMFLLKRDNAPATLSEFFKATSIPKSSIKNIFYVKSAKERFEKVETGGLLRWRLADADAEAERLEAEADE